MTKCSIDEEWWGELIGNMEELVEEMAEPETAVNDFPLTVYASNPAISAQLLDAKGHMIFNGKSYRSPSGAGQDASGWKSCNGWTYWRYQHPHTGAWHTIQELRKNSN